jgi:hypothetical protein
MEKLHERTAQAQTHSGNRTFVVMRVDGKPLRVVCRTG